MQRVCLGMLRFCLAAWMGIAVFFVGLLIDLRQSDLFTPDALFNHPKVLFPLYYGFELATLGPALACAFIGLGNARTGRARKRATLAIVVIAAALAIWDYAIIYQNLVELMNAGHPGQPWPPEFHALHRLSRSLNTAIVGAIAAAAVLSHLPEIQESERLQEPRRLTGGLIRP